MKVKMSKFSSLKQEAKRLGVSESVVREYQAARKAWKDRVRWYSKKYGGIESGEIPYDIRNIRLYKDENVEEFLLSRIESIRSKTRNASRYLREQQQNYILNVITKAESAGLDILSPGMLDNIKNMTNKELGNIVNELSGQLLEIYYEMLKDKNIPDDEADEYLISQTERALKNVRR